MAKTLRYEYPDEEFKGAFIEFNGSWTRRELREWIKAEGEDFIAMLQEKVVAISLGDITDPTQISNDALDDIPLPLFEWFSGIVTVVYVEVNRLGEASRRLALRILEPETQTAE